MTTHPSQNRHPALRARRIGVFGGTQLSDENAAFCGKLGQELASVADLVIVSGGFKHLTGAPEDLSADYSIVKGAADWLEERDISIDKRIETMIPEPNDGNVVRFEIGKVIRLHGKTRQARRYRVIGTADALVVVGGDIDTSGGKGTEDMVELALALEKPILPLPFTGGVALKKWNENKEAIRGWFGIDDVDDETKRLLMGATPVEGILDDPYSSLARITKELLLHQIKRQCFVMMPFDSDLDKLYENFIRPAVEKSGLVAVRTDRLPIVGNVLEVLRTGISTCAFGLAVISEKKPEHANPNVMYELGFAHALGKPTMIVCKKGSKKQMDKLPFDIEQEIVIGYDSKHLDTLSSSITDVLAEMGSF